MSVFRSALVPAAAVLAGLLLVAGCGGDRDQDRPQGTALVPGAAVAVDSASYADTTAVHGEQAWAGEAESALVPSAAPAARAAAPRSADVARRAAPGGAFALQIGSFRNLDNARRLTARVEALGYVPVLESVVIGGETHHRVVLNGLPDRAEAAVVGERLRSEFGITYLIRQSD